MEPAANKAAGVYLYVVIGPIKTSWFRRVGSFLSRVIVLFAAWIPIDRAIVVGVRARADDSTVYEEKYLGGLLDATKAKDRIEYELEHLTFEEFLDSYSIQLKPGRVGPDPAGSVRRSV